MHLSDSNAESNLLFLLFTRQKLKQKSDVAKKAIEAEYTEKMMVESKKISNKNLRLSQDERIKKLQKECNTKVKENDEVELNEYCTLFHAAYLVGFFAKYWIAAQILRRIFEADYSPAAVFASDGGYPHSR